MVEGMTVTEQLVGPIMPYTKGSPERVRHWVKTLNSLRVPGDIVECGVWRAGNIILARQLLPDRVCWLYDTFNGMTAPDIVDGLRAVGSWFQKQGRGWAAASVEEVKAIFRDRGLSDSDNLRFIVGRVEETLRVEANLPREIALLRLDTDWYASTKVELEVLYPRLVSGGVLVIDDYGHWPGCRQAVNEFFGDRARRLKSIDYTAVWMQKS